MAGSGPQLQMGAHLPEGILVHDVEGHCVEGGRQVHLILLTPEGAQGLPHSGCPIGKDPQHLSGPPAGPGLCDLSSPFSKCPSTSGNSNCSV